MTPREQCHQEYREAPEEKLMEDREFDKMHQMPPEQVLAFPPETRRKFFATCKYYAGRRQAIHMEGMVVGKRKASDILKERRGS